MTIKTMEDLLVETLKDIYYAEKHILKALPGMVKKAGSSKLKEALETHRKETEGQVDRLDQVFKLLDIAPRGKKCEAMPAGCDRGGMRHLRTRSTFVTACMAGWFGP
jgi:ferritin-like metal-binding protein YciE